MSILSGSKQENHYIELDYFLPHLYDYLRGRFLEGFEQQPNSPKEFMP